MSRRLKMMAIIVASAVLLAVGGTAVVMAQDEAPPEGGVPSDNGAPSDNGGPLAAVAGILGIPEDELAGALQQAQQEIIGEVFTRTLGAILEREVITEEEATALSDWWGRRPPTPDEDAMKAWLEQRPEVAEPQAVRHLLQSVARISGHLGKFIGQPRLLGAVSAKAAEILGIEPEDLVDAFRQVLQQAGEAHLAERLERAVAEGKITAEQAEQIRQQWQRGGHAGPEFLQRLLRLGEEALGDALTGLVGEGRITSEQAERIRQQWQQHRGRMGRVLRQPSIIGGDVLGRLLPRAVDAGRITEEEADEIRSWWQQRPEALDRLIGGE